MERRHAEEVAVTRLYEAATTGNTATLLQLLREKPRLLDQIIVHYSDTETPLHVAAMSGHTDFVGELLSRKKELALEVDNRECSPLHLASAKGYVEIVKMFLSKVEPSSICGLRDELGRTPLHVAVMKGRDAVVKELIDANPNSTRILTHDEETILHVTVKRNRLETLKLILAHVDYVDELLNSKDCDGNTILHLAVDSKHVQTVKYLVGEETIGLEINASNNNGCTPLDLLLQSRGNCKDKEIMKLLQDRGAQRRSTDIPTRTSLAVPTIKTNKSKKNKHRHKDVSRDWVHNMSNALMIVAILIATVAFTAVMSPVGGVFQENTSPSLNNPHPDEHPLAGRSIMAFYQPSLYLVYYWANTTAFLLSLSIILFLVSGFSLRIRLFMWILIITMWVAIVALVLTYYSATRFVTTFPADPNLGFDNPFNTTVDDTDSDLTSLFNTTVELPLDGIALLLLFIVAVNVLRLLIFLVCKFFKCVCKCFKFFKDQTRQSTATTHQDSNV